MTDKDWLIVILVAALLGWACEIAKLERLTARVAEMATEKGGE